MKRTTAVVSILLVMVLVLTGTGAVNAESQKVVVSEELVWSEYSGFWSIFGDKIYKKTYSDGSSALQYIFKNTPQQAYIFGVQPISISPGQDVLVTVMFQGVSCSLGSGGTHDHYIDFYFGEGAARKFVGQVKYPVGCGQYTSVGFSIPNSYFGSAINVPGTYVLAMEESVEIGGNIAKTDNTFRYITVLATTPTAAPTTATTYSPTPSGSFIRVTSNVAGSVYIDNVMSGMTGNTFQVAPGGHDVRVTQSGYSTYTTSVTVDYGATATVSASLSPVYNPTPTPTLGPGQCRDSYGNVYSCGGGVTPTPTPTLGPGQCSAGYTYTNGKCAPSITPPSSQPATTIVQVLQSLLSWLKGLFGLSILGASDVSIGAGAQSFVLTTVASEPPISDYSGGSYSELWGTWMIVDSSQNIVAQKGSWLKLSSSTYSDTATYTFTNRGSYAVVAVVIKIPYTYLGSQWTKGTEAIIGQDKLGVTVKTPAPPAATNPTPPTSSLGSILSSLLTWFKSRIGL